jgi:D-glycero-alpha-D-manno-heptose 1-phosphate guanylyltransferase
MEAIILAGGFGTRLSHMIQDVPKPMASVNGSPFLVCVLNYLSGFGVKRIIMATGYKSEVIEKYFGDSYAGMEISYSAEKEPLGTGGAIKKSLESCRNENVIIINGDTYFNVNLGEMIKWHDAKRAILTIALKKMHNFDRYGTVKMDANSRIVKFNEKKRAEEGLINGGVYIVRRNICDEIKETKFSFEKDYMEKFVTEKKFEGFVSNGYFIDIGVPEDYYKANKELKL